MAKDEPPFIPPDIDLEFTQADYRVTEGEKRPEPIINWGNLLIFILCIAFLVFVMVPIAGWWRGIVEVVLGPPLWAVIQFVCRPLGDFCY